VFCSIGVVSDFEGAKKQFHESGRTILDVLTLEIQGRDLKIRLKALNVYCKVSTNDFLVHTKERMLKL
jgi:hypothetical protein